MQKSAIKEILYGGLSEIITNKNFYYRSSVSSGYSHITDEGQAAVMEFLLMIFHKIEEAERNDLDHRAKQMVMDQLKNEE